MRNPCDAITAPKYNRKDINALTVEQAMAVLKASESTTYHALFALALTTGLRQGELFGLQWEDIDLNRGMLSVRHSLEEVKGKLTLKEPKSRSGKRQITLPEFTVAALWTHKRAMLAGGLLSGGDCVPESRGRLAAEIELCSASLAYRPKISGTARGDHGLRHSAATLLLPEGISVKVIQEMLGHSNVTLTLNTYSRVMPGMQKQAATTFDRLFGEKTA